VTLPRLIRETWTTSKKEAGAVALLGLLVLFARTSLERWSYDLPFRIRPQSNIDELVMVYMDDITHARQNQRYMGAWKRNVHADLVNILTRYGARAIAFDVVFEEEAETRKETDALASAIRKHGKVVLAGDFGTSTFYGMAASSRPILPAPKLLEATPYYAFPLFRPDVDGVMRQHWHGSPDAPSLSWKLASLLDVPVTREPQGITAERWMNYYGPKGTLPAISFHKVLDGETALGAFISNRVIFVGSAVQAGFTGKRQDQFLTPFSDSQEPVWPGVDLHATEFLNLLRNDALRRMPSYFELGFVLFGGVLAAFGLGALRPRTALVAAVISATVIALGSMFLVWQTHAWFAWLVPVAVQIPAALILGIVKKRPSLPPVPTDLTSEFTPGTRGGGTKVADHILIRRVGHGSYGDVWLAKSATGTHRAIKIVDQKSAKDPRFEREFAGLKKFEPVSRAHEGLVDVLHVGRNEGAGQFYYVMELADSCTVTAEEDPEGYVPCTLKSKLETRGAIQPEDCLRIGYGLVNALAFMHQQGLVHRDIKPSNIIFVAGEPKLADIGLVADADETKSFVGTEGYIPPEGPGTPAADVYSLGKVLAEVVAVSTPGDTMLDDFGRFVERASAQNVKERYQSAMEMLTDLKKIVAPSV
jgi:CHASE2 domain-containing sensor protein